MADAVDQCVPAESVARRSARTVARCLRVTMPGVAAGRRPVALTWRLRSHVQVRPVEPIRSDAHRPAHRPPMARYVVTLACDPYHFKRLRYDSAARDGSFAKSRLLRVAFRYPSRAQLGLVGRRRSFPSFRRPTALLGFNRALRRFDPASGWTFPPDKSGGLASGQLAPAHLSLRHFCRSGPTCRSCLCLRPD